MMVVAWVSVVGEEEDEVVLVASHHNYNPHLLISLFLGPSQLFSSALKAVNLGEKVETSGLEKRKK